jgi:hypothetical protein
LDNGFVEKSNKKPTGDYVLSRRIYADVREEGTCTRKKGLDRQTNKEPLVKHIRESVPSVRGSKSSDKSSRISTAVRSKFCCASL